MRFILALVVLYEAHLTMESDGNNVTLFMTPGSEVCPGEVVTLRCVLYSPEQQLLWVCPEGGPNGERSVLCSSRGNIRDLECNQGTFSVAKVSCNEMDGYIVSDATYNVTTEVGMITCADLNNVSVSSSLQFGASAPTTPVLSWEEGLNTDISRSVNIHWNSSFESNTVYEILVAPPPPQCSDPCVYRTTESSVSIPLLVGVQYNITGRAERCNGTLSSNESAVHVTLQDAVISPTEIVTNEGENVTFICKPFIQQARPILRIFDPGSSNSQTVGIQTDPRVDFIDYDGSNRTFIWTEVNRTEDHLRRFQCEYNSYFTSLATLHVNFPPEYETIDPVSAMEGDRDLVVTLPLSSRPDPDFQWTLNGEIIQSSPTRFLTASSVTLSTVSEEDNGTYVVTASNSAGTGRGSFTLYVTDNVPAKGSDQDELIGIVSGSVVGPIVLIAIAILIILLLFKLWKRKRKPHNQQIHSMQTITTKQLPEVDAPNEQEPVDRTMNLGKYPILEITGQLHVHEKRGSAEFQVENGSVTDGPLQCDKSRGIAVSENRIVITDQEMLRGGVTQHSVKVFDKQKPNEILFKIVGPFDTPRGVAMDEDECIYVADSDNNRIVKFRRDGQYLKQRGQDDKFGDTPVNLRKPYGLHISAKLLYVCDSGNSWIQIFDLELTLLYRLGGQHADPRFLYTPVGIVYNTDDNNLYVVDTGKNKISIINIEGEFYHVSVMQSMVSSDQQVIHFHKMRGITLCNGHIVVTQVDQHSFVCLSVEGQMKGKQDLKYPTDLTVYGNTVYVCSASNEVGAIQCYPFEELIQY